MTIHPKSLVLSVEQWTLVPIESAYQLPELIATYMQCTVIL